MGIDQSLGQIDYALMLIMDNELRKVVRIGSLKSSKYFSRDSRISWRMIQSLIQRTDSYTDAQYSVILHSLSRILRKGAGDIILLRGKRVFLNTKMNVNILQNAKK